MNNQIKKDLFRYVGRDAERIIMQLRYVLFVPGFQYTYLLRKSQFGKCRLGRLFYATLLKLCSYKFAIQIPSCTKIGEGFRILHWGHIVVNPGVVIGRNFNIAQGCLIGNAEGAQKGTPVIGDNVYMSANSIIIGGVKIGNNVLIAPGAFVNFDVPDNSIVIGNPGKIIQRESSPTDKYIVYSI